MSYTSLYEYYEPSLPNAISAAVVFGVLFIIHAVCIVRTRKWFCIAALVGGFFEIVGFVSRAQSHEDLAKKSPFITQAIAILLAPILFAATAYSFLGRMIQTTGRLCYSIIRVTWMTKIFVGGDALCFLIQAGGAAVIVNAKSDKAVNIANNVVLGGLWLQIAVFVVYILTTIVFDYRLRNDKAATFGCQLLYWKKYMNLLYAVSILIIVRNIFRAIEYIQGQQGYLITHEWPLYVFDAAPMAVVMLLIVFWYSADLRVEDNRSNQPPFDDVQNEGRIDMTTV